MTNIRYTFTSNRDFRDNAELQLFADTFPELFNTLEQHCGGKYGYRGDAVAENLQHFVERVQCYLRSYTGHNYADSTVERYLRHKHARDFAERAELIAACHRATLLVNNALYAHGEEPLKLPKLVCDFLNSNKLTEQRSTAQLLKYLAGVRNVLLRAYELDGGFRLHSTICEHAASLACVKPELVPTRLQQGELHGSHIKLVSTWCWSTLTFAPKQLRRAAYEVTAWQR